MLKSIKISVLLLLGSMAAQAQTDHNDRGTKVTVEPVATTPTDQPNGMQPPAGTAAVPSTDIDNRVMMPQNLPSVIPSDADTLHLPALTMRGEVMPTLLQPLYWGGWNTWSLHKGMNVTLGASVFAEFGKHARGGAGFTQNISAMYAMPVTKKLSVAVGGYFSNVMWQHDTWRDAGLSAVAGYKFNDHWEAYLYGQKSVAGSRRFVPAPVWDTAGIGDRIGAAVKYNVNRNFSFQVSVEQNWAPSRFRPRATFGPEGYYPEW